MGRRPEIPQTKRSMYRPMNQMNGDYLTQLKKPVCSELTPDFRGGMRARDEQCRQQIDLWYKDQEYSLRKINRSEDSVYGTLIAVHKEKRRLQRKAHRDMQEDARRQSFNSTSQRSSISKPPVLPKIATYISEPLANEQGVRSIGNTDSSQQLLLQSEQNNPLSPQDITIDMANGDSSKQSFGLNDKEKSDSDMNCSSARRRSKILEVQKGCSEPLVREIVEVDEIPEDTVKKPRKKKRKAKQRDDKVDCLKVTVPEPKPMAKSPVESMPLHILPNKSYRPKLTVTMPVIDENEKSDAYLASSINKGNKLESPELSTTEKEVPALLSPRNFGLVTVLSNSLVSVSADSFLSAGSKIRSPHNSSMVRPDSPSASSHRSDSQQQKLSLVILNKRRNKLRDKQRKQILDSEKLQLYDRNEKGQLTPALRTFKRKPFTTPSAREIHYRRKLMTELEVVKELQSKRVETFFQKLDAEKGEILKPFRVRQQVEEEPTHREPPKAGLVSLERIAAVYGKGRHSLPEGIEPGSIEAMKHCSYLRSYDLDKGHSDDSRTLTKKKIRRYSNPVS